MKKFIIESFQKIFKIRIYNEKTLKAIREAEEDENLQEFNSLEEMFEDLDI
jgi:antitoxin component of RelBE/YafQ-DinJ toxin-antitoxin module